MDLYNDVWDFNVVGLPSPTHSENGLDFSSPFIQASFDGFDGLNAYNEKSDALAAEWMDKAMDLSILEDMESQPDILNDLEAMVGDPAALLDNLMDWSSEFLRNESDTANAKPEKGTSFEQDIFQNIGPSPPASPSDKVPDIGFAALPELIQDSLYRQTFISLPMNVNSVSLDDKSNGNYDISEYLKVELNTPADTDIDDCTVSTPPLTPLSFVPSVECISTEDNTGVNDNTSVQVPIPHSSFVLDSSLNSKNSDNESKEESDLSIKGHNSDNTSSPVFKADAESHLQVKRGRRSRKKAVSPLIIKMPVEIRRKERKRVQNKDAATRYRQKKRKETQVVVEEELALETRNKELTSKVDALTNEISYLKGLLNEAKLRAQAKQKNIL